MQYERILQTAMPRDLAAFRSMLSVPVAAVQINRNRLAASCCAMLGAVCEAMKSLVPVLLLMITGADAAPVAFEQYCFKCHDATQAEGDLDLEDFISKQSDIASVATLEEIIVRIAEGDMPPKKSRKQPDAAQKAEMIAWAQGKLDAMAEELIRSSGGVPAFLNYRGFPATLCTSINDVIVHGIPDATAVVEGDIIGVDCGVLYKGYYGDAARTFAIGSLDAQAQELLTVTEASLHRAVALVRAGGRLSDIGHAVQAEVERAGFSVVKDFVGHGIGSSLHEDPQVPNFGLPGRGPRLEPGLVLAIEPMVNAGRPGVKIDADGWTARTADGSLSAHFEVSVAVTEEGPRVLGRPEFAVAA